jgi:hypothetical protein
MSFSRFLATAKQPAGTLSILGPVSPSAESIRDLGFFALAVTRAIFTIFVGVLIYTLYRFRHGPPSSATEPPQVYGSNAHRNCLDRGADSDRFQHGPGHYT